MTRFIQTLKVFLLFIVVSIPLASSKSIAAEIRVVPTGTSLELIVLRGVIEKGDADRFQGLVRSVIDGAVLFESPGGNLLEGLSIGRKIRDANFSTGVASDTACASACALAWLGGTTRYMDPSSLVGFHSAYIEENGRLSESGVGNALVGAYLNELGFGFDAVVFVSSAAPNEMNWLNASKARRAGIEVILLRADGTEARIDEEQILKLPSGFRWIVLESAMSPSLLHTAQIADQIVRTQNGYAASIIGPYEKSVAENLLLSKGLLTADAYLSSGNGFLFSISQ